MILGTEKKRRVRCQRGSFWYLCPTASLGAICKSSWASQWLFLLFVMAFVERCLVIPRTLRSSNLELTPVGASQVTTFKVYIQKLARWWHHPLSRQWQRVSQINQSSGASSPLVLDLRSTLQSFRCDTFNDVKDWVVISAAKLRSVNQMMNVSCEMLSHLRFQWERCLKIMRAH